MKKRFLVMTMIISIVLLFSVVFIGAGKNDVESRYIGIWEAPDSQYKSFRMVVYSCHVGEFVFTNDKDEQIIDNTFRWDIDNGYLVVDGFDSGSESIRCYLSTDGGKTMKRITEIGGTEYIRVE